MTKAHSLMRDEIYIQAVHTVVSIDKQVVSDQFNVIVHFTTESPVRGSPTVVPSVLARELRLRP
jgi:hypothetical protein